MAFVTGSTTFSGLQLALELFHTVPNFLRRVPVEVLEFSP